VPGYPIRKPSDHSSVDSSPRHIAASHVLHRPLMPRHPPTALNNLTTTNQHTQHTPQTHNPFNNKEKQQHACGWWSKCDRSDARIHYTILKHHTNPRSHNHPPLEPRSSLIATKADQPKTTTLCGCCLRTQQVPTPRHPSATLASRPTPSAIKRGSTCDPNTTKQ
jgi:hypothetical protein